MSPRWTLQPLGVALLLLQVDSGSRAHLDGLGIKEVKGQYLQPAWVLYPEPLQLGRFTRLAASRQHVALGPREQLLDDFQADASGRTCGAPPRMSDADTGRRLGATIGRRRNAIIIIISATKCRDYSPP